MSENWYQLQYDGDDSAENAFAMPSIPINSELREYLKRGGSIIEYAKMKAERKRKIS